MAYQHLCGPAPQLGLLSVVDDVITAGRDIIHRCGQNDAREVLCQWVAIDVSSANQRKAESERRHQS
jgi:hypothetical protein